MRDRYFLKKDAKGAYDPQVGAAATAQTALAQQAQQWNQDFYNQHVAPSLDAMATQTKESTDQQNQLFALNMAQTQQAADRYNTLGIPAENSYYQMVKDYSAPAYQ
jgi:hypothetical protein